MRRARKNVPSEGDDREGQRHGPHTRPEETKIDRTVDVRALGCPGPLMELMRTMKGSPVGTVIELLLNDNSSIKGIPMWVTRSKHQLIRLDHFGDYARIVVKKIR